MHNCLNKGNLCMYQSHQLHNCLKKLKKCRSPEVLGGWLGRGSKTSGHLHFVCFLRQLCNWWDWYMQTLPFLRQLCIWLYVSLYLSISPYFFHIPLYLYVPLYLLSIYLSIYICIHISLYIFLFLSTSLHISLYLIKRQRDIERYKEM